MSYTLACNTDLFAAIGPDSATMLDACTAPHRTSVIHMHGTADHFPYSGGQGARTIDGPSIPEVNATWRKVDHCGPADITPTPRSPHRRRVRGRPRVELITIDGARHQCPAVPPSWNERARHRTRSTPRRPSGSSSPLTPPEISVDSVVALVFSYGGVRLTSVCDGRPRRTAAGSVCGSGPADDQRDSRFRVGAQGGRTMASIAAATNRFRGVGSTFACDSARLGRGDQFPAHHAHNPYV